MLGSIRARICQIATNDSPVWLAHKKRHAEQDMAPDKTAKRNMKHSNKDAKGAANIETDCLLAAMLLDGAEWQFVGL